MRTTQFLRSVLAPFLAFITIVPMSAQAPGFSGFVPGNLVLSRSVYMGDASTVTVGQSLPPICPSTAACGTGKATDNGNSPIAGSTNNVWNNAKPDGSFGVTSPIFLDQITPSGTLVNTLAIPTNMVATSFPSKSELGLNLSVDGSVLTFMAYVAPINAIDVSNSNTPGVYDPTNPAGASYYRGVVQVAPNGAIQVTNTNSYPGNNGRAAILANGLYYMAGNSNNGSGTPANVISATGVQMATPNQASSTAPVMVGNFSITQVNDPSTGLPYATADKAGKDNNFRGLTIFNNTLYTTKGSGGNGINTLYQVGTAGTLPTLANAATTQLTIPPGFPTGLAKNAGAMFPFGIFFANATTVYIADEGDGTAANAATSTTSGLQKWVFANGKWSLAYTMQNGLNLGQPYSVANYPTSLNPSTDGLRNIAGKVNSDGTVTIWAITSTVSANGDQGADPNQLVTITDTLANTDPAAGAKQKFSILRTAAYNEVLRGISLTPTAASSTATTTPTITSAANYGALTIAPGSLATASGSHLSTGSPVSPFFTPLPTIYDGTTVTITDSAKNTVLAPLLYVSPGQVNFQVPSNVAAGAAQITIQAGDGVKSTATVQIAAVSPGLFTFNNAGLAAAAGLRVSATGAQSPVAVYALSAGGAVIANPISLGAATDQVYLTLFGTGLQAAGTTGVKVTIGGVSATVSYAGPQGTYAGLDQVNVLVPASLAGKGNVNVALTANGIAANPAQVTIQ